MNAAFVAGPLVRGRIVEAVLRYSVLALSAAVGSLSTVLAAQALLKFTFQDAALPILAVGLWSVAMVFRGGPGWGLIVQQDVGRRSRWLACFVFGASIGAGLTRVSRGYWLATVILLSATGPVALTAALAALFGVLRIVFLIAAFGGSFNGHRRDGIPRMSGAVAGAVATPAGRIVAGLIPVALVVGGVGFGLS